MPRRETWSMGEAHLIGVSTYIGTNKYTVLARDASGKILLATTIISDPTAETGAGFSRSCLLIKNDTVTGTKGLYENQGTTTAASFNVVGAIITAEIATSAVTTTKVADSAITSAKMGSLAISSAKIANLGVPTAKLAASAVTSAKIGSLEVPEAKIANLSISSGKLISLAVSSSKIANLAVSSAKIANLGVSAAKLATEAVISGKIKMVTTSIHVTSALTSASVYSATYSGGTIIGVYPSNAPTTAAQKLKSVAFSGSTGRVVLTMKAAVTLNANSATYKVVIVKAS